MKQQESTNSWLRRMGISTTFFAAVVVMLGGWTTAASARTAAISRTEATATVRANASCPTGTAPGATSKKVTVAATIIDITGSSLSNATVGVPSAQQQEKDWTLVAASINKAGGAGCRKITMSFYDVNPIDAAEAEQECLTIAGRQPYIVLDSGALTDVGASNCIPQHKIPLLSGYLTQADLTQYYPYYLQAGDLPNDGARNGILGLKKLGYFSASKDFKKLGLLYHTCTPGYLQAQQDAISEAGIPKSDVVSFSLGCPAGQNDTPASMEQAVLSFKSGGVTDVTEAGVNDFGMFTQVAQQQDYKPRYVLDDTTIATGVKTGNDAFDATNANGAIDVVSSGYGEATTPGFKPSGGTEKCDAVYSAGGEPSVYKQADGYGGVVCDYLWLVQAILDHAKTVQTDKLASDMHSVGTVEFAYAGAPTNFSAAPAGQPYGVSYWRPIFYHSSCACWEVPNATFYPPINK